MESKTNLDRALENLHRSLEGKERTLLEIADLRDLEEVINAALAPLNPSERNLIWAQNYRAELERIQPKIRAMDGIVREVEALQKGYQALIELKKKREEAARIAKGPHPSVSIAVDPGKGGVPDRLWDNGTVGY